MQWLVSLLTGPLINGALKAYSAKLAAGNTSERIASEIAVRELTVQQREIEVQAALRTAQIGKWYEPEHLFAYIMVVYFGKIILWDKVFAYWTNGSTDAITGDAAVWAGMVFTFYLGKRGFENVARIIKSK